MYLRVWDVFSLFSIHEGFVKRGIEEIVGNLRSLQQQILGLQRRVQEIEEQVLSVAFYFLSHGVMESWSHAAVVGRSDYMSDLCPVKVFLDKLTMSLRAWKHRQFFAFARWARINDLWSSFLGYDN